MASNLLSLISAKIFLICLALIPRCHPNNYVVKEEDKFDDNTPLQYPQEFEILNSSNVEVRYLLYDVNPGEGFNLRRDVYMRIANMVKFLNQKNSQVQWVLVLPPWGRIYHWKTAGLDQIKIPWFTFFDLASLAKLVPVIELQTYLKTVGPSIEEIMYLQRYAEGWKDDKWEERIDERPCNDPTGFFKDENGRWRWWFWGYEEEMYGVSFRCMSVQFQYHSMADYIHDNVKAKTLFIARSESVNHGRDSNWSPVYWTARRSMRFADHLIRIGDSFRRRQLNSTDEEDRTVMDNDWREMKRQHGDALGGPYVAVHLRRKDFLRSHGKQVPSLEQAAKRIAVALDETGLNTVFVASDERKEEFNTLKSLLSSYNVKRFEPSLEILDMYKDGGVAIIDQWICAHARYFIGTYVSTFSFRIHEEREILGFRQETTYNRFCGTQEDENCEQPSKWEIKYE